MVMGKRFHSQRENQEEGKNQRRRGNDKDERGNDELIVYRILCPDGVIGSVIGKSGKVINSVRQETRAKVKVVDPFPGAKDRVITIYCYVKEKEEIDVDDEFSERKPLCAAQDALLKVHAAIANAVATASDLDKNQKNKEECQILVPSSQSANIIGKGGSTIKKLRTKTKTSIKVTAKDASDPSHSCAMEFDNFVTISGEEAGVRKALLAISSIMYKFTPIESIPLETTVQEALPSIIIPSDVPIYPPGGLYPSVDPLVPSRSVASILGATRVQDLQDYADTQNTWPLYSSTVPVISGVSGTARTEELIIKILCPFDKIGRVIGKGGGTIKSIRQTSGARVDIDDSKQDRNDCLIIVTSTESLEDVKSMAVETVLLLQGKINDEDADVVSMRILVPSKIIGCIIGKSGSIINEIRKNTKADIRISKGDKSKRADLNDEVVEVGGEVGKVRDALVQIILRLREDALRIKDTAHKSYISSESIYQGGASHSMSSVLPSIPPVTSLGYDHKSETGSGGVGLYSFSDLYGYGSLPLGEHEYGGRPSHSSRHYGRLPSPSSIEMLIPSNAVGKVMGKGGANIINIRKISGAMIEISDSKLNWGDRIAVISGTSEQRRSAENLIQAFIMAT